MKEWMEQLKAHYTEEAKDHEEYMRIADMAEHEGDCCEAGIIRDIAHEEMIHRKLIGEMMHDMHE